MKEKRYFQKLYKFEDESKTYLIEVSLDDYNDVYDDWDPSPFKKRDIEDEFNDFIVNSSEDIPLNMGITIILHLPESKKDIKKEAALRAAYDNYYNYTLERLNRLKISLHRKTAFYLFFSIFLLATGYFFFGDEQNVLMNVLHEGIFIGGWVFLWEFFTNIFIAQRELHRDYRLYKRLFESEIRFLYHG